MDLLKVAAECKSKCKVMFLLKDNNDVSGNFASTFKGDFEILDQTTDDQSTLVCAYIVNVTSNGPTEAWNWCKTKVSMSDIIKM